MSDREALIDALVMSPMSDTVGTDMSRVSRTADEILSSDWLAKHDAEVAASALEVAAAALGHNAPDIGTPGSRWRTYGRWLCARADRLRREVSGDD